MPQIDLVPLESNIIWSVIFLAFYLYFYTTYAVYPLLNSLKVNYYVILKRLASAKLKSTKEFKFIGSFIAIWSNFQRSAV